MSLGKRSFTDLVIDLTESVWTRAGLQDLLYSKATQRDELQQHLKRAPNKSISGSSRFSSSSLSTWQEDGNAAVSKERKARDCKLPIPTPIATALLYGIVAVANNFIAKFVLSFMPALAVILLLQMLAMFFCVHGLLLLGLEDFPSFSFQRWLQLLPLSLLYLWHAATVLRCLLVLNVPMYNTLKRLTPVFVLVTKSVMDRKMPSLGIAGSVLMVVGGCTVAGYGDLDFSSSGYTIAILCAMLQAAYILVIEHTGASNTSAGEMMFYNAVTGIPVLMINVFYDDEWLKALVMYDFACQVRGAALVGIFIFLSVFSEFALNGSLILCTIHNTGLTTSIVGVLKGVFAVILGFFLLGGVKFSMLNILGITLAMLGGLVYVLIKHLSSRQSARLPAVRQAASSSGRLSP